MVGDLQRRETRRVTESQRENYSKTIWRRTTRCGFQFSTIAECRQFQTTQCSGIISMDFNSLDGVIETTLLENGMDLLKCNVLNERNSISIINIGS